MKKILSTLFSVTLFLGMGTSAFADVVDVDPEKQKAYDLIEKTNEKIQDKIDKAKEESDKLQADYFADIQKIREESVIDEIEGAQKASQLDLASVEEIQSVLFSIEKELILEQEGTDEIDEITTLLVSSENVPTFKSKEDLLEYLLQDSISKKYEDRTIKYVDQLDKIITKLFTETKKMSDHTIEKVKKADVQAECHWVLESFAGLEVWIDPIRIVGI